VLFIYIHSNIYIYISRFTKTMYNLERMEYVAAKNYSTSRNESKWGFKNFNNLFLSCPNFRSFLFWQSLLQFSCTIDDSTISLTYAECQVCIIIWYWWTGCYSRTGLLNLMLQRLFRVILNYPLALQNGVGTWKLFFLDSSAAACSQSFQLTSLAIPILQLC